MNYFTSFYRTVAHLAVVVTFLIIGAFSARATQVPPSPTSLPDNLALKGESPLSSDEYTSINDEFTFGNGAIASRTDPLQEKPEPSLGEINSDETTKAGSTETIASIVLITASILFIGFSRLRRPRRPVFPAGCAIVTFCIMGMAQSSADPIDVPDFSFETNPWTGWTYSKPGILPGWTFDAPAGSSYGSLLHQATFTSPNTSMGRDYAFIDDTTPGEGATVTTAASLGTIAADTTYTLTVAIGNPDGAGPPTRGPFNFNPMANVAMGDVSLDLLSDGQIFASDIISAGSVDSGDWQDFSVSYTITDSDPIVGQDLTIQMGPVSDFGNAAGASFDDVRLDATAITRSVNDGGNDGDSGSSLSATPEPTNWSLLIIGGFALGWLMRWKRMNSNLGS